MRGNGFFLVLLLVGCSGSAGNEDAGLAGDAVVTGDAVVDVSAGGDGPAGDQIGPGIDSGPAKDVATVKVKWSIVAEQKDVAWDNGYLALHPTQPNTLAVRLEVSSFDPDVKVAVSQDLG